MSSNYSIQLPERIRSSIADDSFIPLWLSHVARFFDETPHYFPEYTNHGINHINTVLQFMDCLIPSHERFPSEVAEIMIASAVVHDIGMQIMPDGFIMLLYDEKWQKEWKKYYAKACRFSDSAMISRWGTPINMQEVFSKEDVIETDAFLTRLIIGDFIREQHGQLAYDISVNGFPGNERKDVFAGFLNKNQRDLIGVIAQSHQLPLRKSETYIENKSYGGSNVNFPLNTPAFYLMVLLRIADYLDANAQRAPKQRQWMQHQTSPESTRQFTLNQVTNTPTFDAYAFHGAVKIDAFPEDSLTFVAVREWIESIQHELDYSWAVLNEKYQSKYGLTVHRIVSNIIDTKTVAMFNKDFLTEKAALKVNPGIAKLLVGPLYGNDPTYGVRELLQNSLDAVRERESLVWQHN